MIEIEENDLEWFGLFPKTVCDIAVVYKYLCTVLNCSRNATHIPEAFETVEHDAPYLKRFLGAFVEKTLSAIKRIIASVNGAELPCKDISIIRIHYEDMVKLIRRITGVNQILPSCSKIGSMLEDYSAAVERNNELLVRKLPVGCKM